MRPSPSMAAIPPWRVITVWGRRFIAAVPAISSHHRSMMNLALLLRATVGLAIPAVALFSFMGKRRRETATGLDGAEDDAGFEGLDGIDLRRAKLAGRPLVGVDVTGCDLSHADLRGAVLTEATICDARLDYADLSRADLRRADLTGTWLLETDFTGADLRGADLSGCRNLSMATLKRVQWDATTRWPPGIDPVARTARPAM